MVAAGENSAAMLGQRVASLGDDARELASTCQAEEARLRHAARRARNAVGGGGGVSDAEGSPGPGSRPDEPVGLHDDGVLPGAAGHVAAAPPSRSGGAGTTGSEAGLDADALNKQADEWELWGRYYRKTEKRQVNNGIHVGVKQLFASGAKTILCGSLVIGNRADGHNVSKNIRKRIQQTRLASLRTACEETAEVNGGTCNFFVTPEDGSTKYCCRCGAGVKVERHFVACPSCAGANGKMHRDLAACGGIATRHFAPLHSFLSTRTPLLVLLEGMAEVGAVVDEVLKHVDDMARFECAHVRTKRKPAGANEPVAAHPEAEGSANSGYLGPRMVKLGSTFDEVVTAHQRT